MEDDRMVKKTNQLETIWEKTTRKTQEQMDRWNPQRYEVLKVKNWKELSRNRKEWKKLVQKAKTHPRL
jgi:hypothetical protein